MLFKISVAFGSGNYNVTRGSPTYIAASITGINFCSLFVWANALVQFYCSYSLFCRFVVAPKHIQNEIDTGNEEPYGKRGGFTR